MIVIDDDLSWQHKGACLGASPDGFFPERGASTRQAKLICRGCCVRVECLEAGLNERFGVWGGLTERERKRIRRQRALELLSATA